MRRHTLTYLYAELVKRQFFTQALRHKISSDKSTLHIVYLDHLFEEQFITVIRTSPLAYRIYYSSKLIRIRTVTEAANKLDEIMSEILSRNKFCSVMTLAELKNYNKDDYQKCLEIRKRFDNITSK